VRGLKWREGRVLGRKIETNKKRSGRGRNRERRNWQATEREVRHFEIRSGRRPAGFAKE